MGGGGGGGGGCRTVCTLPSDYSGFHLSQLHVDFRLVNYMYPVVYNTLSHLRDYFLGDGL